MKRFPLLVFALLLAAPLVRAQQNSTPFSTPTDQSSAGPLRLTLRQVIELGLKANLGVQVAGTRVEEAKGTEERRRSVLYPHVTASHTTSLQNRNLRAMGISAPGIPLPTVVGPFSNYDYRVAASQSLLDRQATHALRASQLQKQAAGLSYQDARDDAVRQSAGLYLNAQAQAAEVEASEARVTTSEALLKLARDQREHGLATGLDVVRMQVQLQRDRQRLLVARDAYQTSLLALQRYLGIRPGAPIELADRLAYHPVEPPAIDETLAGALGARSDYRSLEAQRESLGEQRKSTRARYLPKFGVDGNYGALGRSYGSMPGIGLIEGTVTLTLFDRDRNGEAKEIVSRIDRLDSQMADLRRGIEQDLRKAVLDLDSARQQVEVTQAGVELARRELELARDRFQNGLSDTIEVITAQGSLQTAQDDQISSLARHEDAVMALVRAMGATEKIYANYLGSDAGRGPATEVPRP